VTAEPELHRRRRRVLLLTSVGAFMTPLDGSIVSVALAKIGPSLHLTFSQAIWVQASYLLVISILLIPLGRLADQHGRMRFYLAGVVIFGLASLAAAFSMSGEWLIAARCVQGVGGALLGATSGAIVTAVFPPQERGRALGINVMAVYLGLTTGPPLGGLIVDHLGWQWIFLVNVPIAVATFAFGWSLVASERRDRDALATEIAGAGRDSTLGAGPATARPPAGRLDWSGSALLGLLLAALLVPLTFAPVWGWDSPRTLALLALSGVAAVAFVLVELRVPDPVLDLDLLRHNRLFAAANVAALLNYMAMHGVTILTAIFLEVVQGRSAQQAGLVLIVEPALMAGLSPLAGRLSDRVGSRLLTTAGMLLTAAGMVWLAALPAGATTGRIVVGLAMVGVGMAAFSSPNTSAVMGSVPRSQLGLAAGFLGTMRFAGQAISIGLLGAIAASQLGRLGGRLIFTHAHAAPHAAADFAKGYAAAMLVGAGFALIGAAVSLVRGEHRRAAGAPAAPAPGRPAA
jgi:MFS family permease